MRTIFLSALLAVSAGAFANNIVVSNTALGAQDPGNQTIGITFSVAWENSWRTSSNESNYDGAWLFVKFRKAGTYDWRHCTLDPISTPANGAVLSVSPDSKGAFIHRAADGIGNVSYSGNQLIWQYGTDGVLNNDSVEVRVFALEMVYIPAGPFHLGSGGSETNCFKNGNADASFLVTGPGAIGTGTGSGQLNFNLVGNNALNVPAGYPNGYAAFWIMKYECSQQQYADFLNSLSANQANPNNTYTNFQGSAHPNFTPEAAERAANGIGAAQLFALADWSGLRPYSEMEFEKACRGANIVPVPNEYPWGTTSTTQLIPSQLTNIGLANESINAGSLANAAYGGGLTAAVRVGLFARTSGSSRDLSGATYYGVLNMADNVHELTIRAGSAAGHGFVASTHGDGYLTPSGATDISTWDPGGIGVRGAKWWGPLTDMRVSHRQWAHWNVQPPDAGFGIRLARTAY